MDPADFATIYNTAPLLAAGINGTGQTIAVVGRSDILMSDVQTYRQLFNLPPNDPIFIHAGQDNGTEPGDDGESDLDVEISGGIAPNATVKFVIGTPTFNVDGITNSIEYIVENNIADIMSISYGSCEAVEGAGGNPFEQRDLRAGGRAGHQRVRRCPATTARPVATIREANLRGPVVTPRAPRLPRRTACPSAAPSSMAIHEHDPYHVLELDQQLSLSEFGPDLHSGVSVERIEGRQPDFRRRSRGLATYGQAAAASALTTCDLHGRQGPGITNEPIRL